MIIFFHYITFAWLLKREVKKALLLFDVGFFSFVFANPSLGVVNELHRQCTPPLSLSLITSPLLLLCVVWSLGTH